MQFGFVFLFLALIPFNGIADSLRQGTCPKPGYECSQCDVEDLEKLQKLLSSVDAKGAKPEIKSVEDLLRELPDSMKNNMIVIGGSMSAQESTPGRMYDPKNPPGPRILFKSANGEAFVGISLDPKSKKYKSVEIMQWDGKRGAFQFKEVDFARGKGSRYRHDASGDCVKCHSERRRANWDTYRAWAGIFPPKNDVLYPNDPSTKVYMDLMRRVAIAKTRDPKSRLAQLPIPGPPYQQGREPDGTTKESPNGVKSGPAPKAFVPPEMPTPQVKKQPFLMEPPDISLPPPMMPALPPSKDFVPPLSVSKPAQIMIQAALDELPQISQPVPAAPSIAKLGLPPLDSVDIGMELTPMQKVEAMEKILKNGGQILVPHYPETDGDGVTIDTFDQLSELNACQISRELREHPDYQKFKYALTAALLCPQMPIIDFISDEKAQELGNYFGGRTPLESKNKLAETVSKSGKLLDTEKTERHLKLLKEMGATPKDLKGLTSLEGAGEIFSEEITSLRFLLEPLGINVGEWSMSFGSDLSRPHYNFADVFPLHRQKAVLDVEKEFLSTNPTLKSGDPVTSKNLKKGSKKSPDAAEREEASAAMCAWLEKKSVSSMADAKVISHKGIQSYLVPCKEGIARGKSAFVAEGKAVFKSKCLQCHISSTVVPAKMVFADQDGMMKSYFKRNHSGGSSLEHFRDAVVGVGPKKMPPMGPDLSPSEKAALMFYLGDGMSKSKEGQVSCEAIFGEKPKAAGASRKGSDGL